MSTVNILSSKFALTNDHCPAIIGVDGILDNIFTQNRFVQGHY